MEGASGTPVFYGYDPQGNLVHRYDPNSDHASISALYDAFGQRLGQYSAWNSGEAGVSDPVGFGGQYGNHTDTETGLVLMTHRYYDARKGRFVNRDPIGYQGGMNLYGYCGNNPVTRVDPSGLDPVGFSDGNGQALWDPAPYMSSEVNIDFSGPDELSSSWAAAQPYLFIAGMVVVPEATIGYGIISIMAETAADKMGLDPVVGDVVVLAASAGRARGSAGANAVARIGITQEKTAAAGYNYLAEVQLDEGDWGRRDCVHFNRSNEAMDKLFQSDPASRITMEQQVPGIAEAVNSKGGRINPPGYTWHHATSAQAGGRMGVMQLVPVEQHTAGSAWWSKLHSDPGGLADIRSGRGQGMHLHVNDHTIAGVNSFEETNK